MNTDDKRPTLIDGGHASSDALEALRGSHRAGHRNGEIIVINGGTGGRSMIVEQVARKLMDQGRKVGVYGEHPEPLKDTDIPEYLTVPDVSGHPTGKKTKLKKRRLKRKPGKP